MLIFKGKPPSKWGFVPLLFLVGELTIWNY